jgi:hypothetical protein
VKAWKGTVPRCRLRLKLRYRAAQLHARRYGTSACRSALSYVLEAGSIHPKSDLRRAVVRYMSSLIYNTLRVQILDVICFAVPQGTVGGYHGTDKHKSQSSACRRGTTGKIRVENNNEEFYELFEHASLPCVAWDVRIYGSHEIWVQSSDLRITTE